VKLAIAAFASTLLVAGSSPVTPGPSLSVPRAVHTATLLKSGKVLIAGGCTRGTCEVAAEGATTELFDPARNRFEPGPRMTHPRVGHTATRLVGGDVLIAGGWDRADGDPTASAELFEHASGRFVPVGSMRARRGGATASLLRDGRVLIVGGTDGSSTLRSAEIFDLRTRSFRRTGATAVPRGSHSAARLAGGKVLVAGGSADRDRVLASAELYDPRTGRFSRVGSLKVARHKHAVVALPGGGALVVGGSNAHDFDGRHASAEVFSVRTRRFVRVGSMLNARFKLDGSIVVLRPGVVLVAGGARAVEIYNGKRRRFGWIGATGARLMFATATLLRDGRVLFAGGYDDGIQISRRAWLIRA
jgi:Kelch motif/Galactose oxidase, central domain